MLAAVTPYALGGLVLLLLLHAALRRWVLTAVTAGLVALNAAWLAPLYVADEPGRGMPLVVLQANLYFGQADAEHLVALVRQNAVDVLAVQELDDAAVARLRAAGLERELPFSVLLPFRAADGSGMWSRYPVQPLEPFPTRFRSPGGLVQTPAGTVEVRVLHPIPATPAFGGEAYRRDFDTIRTRVEALDDSRPRLLVGDFNASVDHLALRRLMGDRYRDAAEIAGAGLQRTWGTRVGGRALFHLDHVLVNRHLDVRGTAVLDLPGSDHRAVLAVVLVQEGD
jgi:endonuclease/exonuclease/phosphatase (EEP) superfamily protein YafD